MPVMSRGEASIANDGAETLTGLSGRLYTQIKTTATTKLAELGESSDLPVDAKRAMASASEDQAESFTPGVALTNPASGAVTVNFSNGYHQKLILGGNVTITFSNLQDAATVVIHIEQNGTGGHTVTWPGNAKFRNVGGESAVTATAGAHDVFVGHVVGTDVWFSVAAKNLV